MTRETLNELAGKWEQLAREARQRAQIADEKWPPGYWYGVAQGYEMAAADLKAEIGKDNNNSKE